MESNILKPKTLLRLVQISEDNDTYVKAMKEGGTFDDEFTSDIQYPSKLETEDVPSSIDDEFASDTYTEYKEPEQSDENVSLISETVEVVPSIEPIKVDVPDEKVNVYTSPIENAKVTAGDYENLIALNLKASNDITSIEHTDAVSNLKRITAENPEEISGKAKIINGEPEDLEKQAFSKYSNDFFFLNYFKKPGDLEKINNSNSLINDYKLADKEELWNDSFIQQDYIKQYGTSARQVFDNAYTNIFNVYKSSNKEAINNSLNENRLITTATGSKFNDMLIASSNGGVDKMREVKDIYSKVEKYTSPISAGIRLKGAQAIIDGNIGLSPYETVYEASINNVIDEYGELHKVDDRLIKDYESKDKWFAVESDIYQANLTDVGTAAMYAYDMNERQRLDTQVVAKWELTDDVGGIIPASWMRGATQTELEGLGDWVSVVPKSLFRLGFDLTNSAVNMANATTAMITGSGIDSSVKFKNNLRKYSTAGKTYDMVNNMWGIENIFSEGVNGVLQLGVAYGIGGALKGSTAKLFPKQSPIIAQSGTRLALTMYGVGTVYDEFLDAGFSERDAGNYSVTAFLGMWWANGLSSWVSDGFTNKAALKSVESFIKTKVSLGTNIAKETIDEAAKFNKMYSMWKNSGIKKVFDKAAMSKVGQSKMLSNTIQEGTEEMLEEVASEVNNQVANFMTWAHAKENDRDYFKTVTDEGYWGEFANNLAFSGVLGGITGSIPGGFSDIKRIANRKSSDIKKEQLDSYIDVLTLNDDALFYESILDMEKKGFLGSDNIRQDGTEGGINNNIPTNMSQRAFNKMMILNDFELTKKQLGESRRIPNLAPSETNIDMALLVKDSYDKLVGTNGVYSKYDIGYDDYKKMSDPKIGLKNYNEARVSDNKEIINEDDYAIMREANNFIDDVKSGVAHQYAWFKEATKDNMFFGSDENRIESLKGKEFDNLIIEYFRGTMNNAYDTLNEEDTKLQNLTDHSIEINNVESKDLDVLIDKLKGIGVILPADKILLLKKVTEKFNSEEELQPVDDAFISMWQEHIANDLSKVDDMFSDLDLEAINEKKRKFDNKDEGAISLSTRELDYIAYTKGKEKLAELWTSGSDKFLDGLKKTWLYSLTIPELTADGTFGVTAMKRLAEKDGVESIATEVLLTVDDASDTYNVKDIPQAIIDYNTRKDMLIAEVNSIPSDTVDSIENRKRLDVSFLEKINEITTNGKVKTSSITYSDGMIEYIDGLLNTIPEGLSKEEEADYILEVNQREEVVQHRTNMVIHQNFMSVLQDNLGTLNSVHRIIERSKNDTLLQRVHSVWDDTMVGSFIKRNFWFKGKTKYNLNDNVLEPTMAEKSRDINAEINKINKELLNEDLSPEDAENLEEQKAVLKEMIPYNFFDHDRMVHLSDMSLRTEEQQDELDTYKERQRLLEGPSEKLIDFLSEIDGTKIESLNNEIEELNEELSGLAPNHGRIDDINSKIEDKEKEKSVLIEDSVKSSKIKIDSLIKQQKEWLAIVNNPRIPDNVRGIYLSTGSPISSFIKDKLDNKFDSIKELLTYTKTFFNSNEYTIIDKSEISKALMAIMEDQGVALDEKGVGANYDMEIKKSVTDLFSNINSIFGSKKDLFNCK